MNISPLLSFSHRLADCDDPLEIRRQILAHLYYWCPHFAPSFHRPALTPNAISGNGNVKQDLAIAWRMQKCFGDTRYWSICLGLYGTTNLVTGACEILTSTPQLVAVAYSGRDHDGLGVNPSAQSFLDCIMEDDLAHTCNPHDSQLAEHDWLFVGHEKDVSILATDTDMMAILNARGTVILNADFHDTPQQKMVIVLAIVALELWKSGIADPVSYPLLCDYRMRRKMVKDLITLLRDDIHKYMQDAIKNFDSDAKQRQDRHVSVFLHRIHTWERARRHQYRIEDAWARCQGAEQQLQDCMCLGREMMESQLASARGLAASLIGRIQPLVFGFFNHDSEYMGNQELETGTNDYDCQFDFPWLLKRSSGYWFDCEEPVNSCMPVDAKAVGEMLAAPAIFTQTVAIPDLEGWDFEPIEPFLNSPPPLHLHPRLDSAMPEPDKQPQKSSPLPRLDNGEVEEQQSVHYLVLPAQIEEVM